MDVAEIAAAVSRPSHASSALASGGISIHSFRRSRSTEVIDAVRVAMRPATARIAPRLQWLAFGVVGVVACTTALLNGGWQAWTFAVFGAVLTGLALAAKPVERQWIHEVVLDRDHVHIRLLEDSLEFRAVLSRYWTRVTLTELGAGTKLVLEHKGETVELGGFLEETPRRLLAEWLQRLIGPMGSAPSLSTTLGYGHASEVETGASHP